MIIADTFIRYISPPSQPQTLNLKTLNPKQSSPMWSSQSSLTHASDSLMWPSLIHLAYIDADIIDVVITEFYFAFITYAGLITDTA